MTASDYRVSIEGVRPRPIAAVRARMAIECVPATFAQHLNQVYAAARSGHVTLDGQNIFVYRAAPNGEVDIDFGVGAAGPFSQVGAVSYTETPGGRAATTTHWGEYGGLGGAHAAVARWCREHGHVLAGPRWEVYGHWNDDPAQRRTDVYYLLSD